MTSCVQSGMATSYTAPAWSCGTLVDPIYSIGIYLWIVISTALLFWTCPLNLSQQEEQERWRRRRWQRRTMQTFSVQIFRVLPCLRKTKGILKVLQSSATKANVWCFRRSTSVTLNIPENVHQQQKNKCVQSILDLQYTLVKICTGSIISCDLINNFLVLKFLLTFEKTTSI